MATKLKTYPINSFVGGLNTYANPSELKDNESPDMLNCIFKGLSGITNRKGFIKLVTAEVASGKKIQGIFFYATASGKEILYVSDGTLYKYDGAGGSTAISGGTFSDTANVNACQLGDRLYFADGVTALSYYNGTAISTTGIASAPTKVKQLIKYNNRLYCNSDDNRDRVYYGGALTATGAADNTGNFASTTPAFAGFLGFGLGRVVTGFAKKDSTLYVTFENCTYKIDPVAGTGTSSALDHSNVLVSNSFGTRSPRSIENIGNDIGFLDSQYIFLGEVANYVTIRTRTVSGAVSTLFQNITPSAISDVAAIYYDAEEMLLIAAQVDSTVNDHIIGYAAAYKAWFYWDGIKANSFLDFVDENNVKHLYFASDDPSASYIYELFQGLSDDGVAVNRSYKTKIYDIKEFNVQKIFQEWSLLFGGIYGNLTVNVYVDGTLVDTVTFSSGNGTYTSDGFGTLPFGTFPMGLEGNFAEASSSASTLSNDWRWHTLGTAPEGSTIQFELVNNNLNEGFEITRAAFDYLRLPAFNTKPSSREV